MQMRLHRLQPQVAELLSAMAEHFGVVVNVEKILRTFPLSTVCMDQDLLNKQSRLDF